ncbi:protein PHLOEM PROTEIN 2-LIKE A1 [Citrus sinensis]|nr:protein PHLOEM PROTEIN 2-LIKE A1 [Citrus sinensis]
MNFKAAAAAAKHESTEEFLEHKRKKRWIDNKSGYNCFMLYPRSLYGCHWSNRQYWDWRCFKETSDENIEVVKLICVCWLDVSGTFKISDLSPGVLYELVYVKPRGQWIELSVGIFLTDQNIYGSSSSSSETAAVSFSLYPDCRPLEIWSYN